MIELKKILIGLIAATGVSTAGAVCTYPESVDVPDGTTASKDEMLAGKKAVEQYMADMEAYLGCIDQEAKDAGEEYTDEKRALDTKRYNAAVDAMEAVAAQFNEQVRAYKSVTQ